MKVLVHAAKEIEFDNEAEEILSRRQRKNVVKNHARAALKRNGFEVKSLAVMDYY